MKSTNAENINLGYTGLSPATSVVKQNILTGGINKDNSINTETLWTHARNAINNSHTGDYLILGSEPSNVRVATASYDIIGSIYIYDNIWAIFSTLKQHPNDTTQYNTTNSGCEIGLFNYNNVNVPGTLTYLRIIDDYNLNFCKTNLINGVSRLNTYGEYVLYFDDGLNPTRRLNLGNPKMWDWTTYRDPKLNVWCNINYMPFDYIWVNNTIPHTPITPLMVNIESLMLVPSLDFIKVHGEQEHNSGGTLPNGIYTIAVAYVLNGNRISEYYLSDPIHIHTESGMNGSINVHITHIDRDADIEYEIVIISYVAEQLTAKKMGIYNLSSSNNNPINFNFDTIDTTLENVPLEYLPLQFNRYQYSKITTTINNNLVRIAPYRHFEPNYQPFANLIIPHFIISEVDEHYYENSGNAVGYMRDEVYSFAIQWLTTYGRTPAYIIPAPPVYDSSSSSYPYAIPYSYNDGENDYIYSDNITSSHTLTTDNNVKVLYQGKLSAFYSTEKYAYAGNENVYRYNLSDYYGFILANNNNSTTFPAYTDIQAAVSNYLSHYNVPLGTYNFPEAANLVNKEIRLVKFPSEIDNINNLKLYDSQNKKIRILGVIFTNILHPVDNYGNFIDNIIGYQILRSDRNGNKTIIAKGIINNYGAYNKTVNQDNVHIYGNGIIQGNENYLYENYPLNDVRPNNLLTLAPAYMAGHAYMNSSNIVSALTSLFTPLNVSSNNSNDFVIKTESDISNYTFINNFSSNGSLSPLLLAGNTINQHKIFSGKYISFHSPEITFKKPVLNVTNLKIYALLDGDAKTNYFIPYNHPKQKLLKKTADIISLILSLNEVQIKMNGKRIVNMPEITIGPRLMTVHAIPDVGYWGGRTIAAALLAGTTAFEYIALSNMEKNGSFLLLNTNGITEYGFSNTFSTINYVAGAAAGFAGASDTKLPTITVEPSSFALLPKKLRPMLFLSFFYNYMNEAYTKYREAVKQAIQYQQYALHSVTHCFYDLSSNPGLPNNIKRINRARYISNHNTTVATTDGNINIMNRDRNRHVFLELLDILKTNTGYDTSRFRLMDLIGAYSEKLDNVFYNNINNWLTFIKNPTNVNVLSYSKVYYTGLLVDNDNVYGDIHYNKYLYVGTPQRLKYTQSPYIYISEVLYSGDTYIGRYAEKNPFFYFLDYPKDKPDGFDYNYMLQRSILYPRYWLSTDINITDALSEAASIIGGGGNCIREFIGALTFINTNIISSHSALGATIDAIANSFNNAPSFNANSPALYNFLLLRMSAYNLDGNVLQLHTGTTGCNLLNIWGGLRSLWFHLSHIGIREFYVESEINLAFRIMGESKAERFYHYVKNSSLHAFVDEDIIRMEDYYKYDWSMSVSKFYLVLPSFAKLQQKTYDCILYELQSGYIDNMVIYSLPQNIDNRRDNWRVFLPLNRKVFDDKVTTIKDIENSGAVILFKNSNPYYITGSSTTSNLSTVIGDGTLLNNGIIASNTSDKAHEYGSMQNIRSIVSTPFGIYYISIEQNKIFQYSTSLSEISNSGIKWWLNKYASFNLLSQFHNYDMIDNPVIGIGALTTYDNKNGIIYFHKIDYKLKDEYTNGKKYRVTYIPGTGLFQVEQYTTSWNVIDYTNAHNLTYFENVSWTLSYDPKIKAFISFHDWHPNLTGGLQDTFFSVKGNFIYVHNQTCTSYCRFYDVQYPFEIEYEINNSFEVMTLRNIEYILEAYKYEDNCIDRFHLLDENFTECVVYNSEQCSGKLVLFPKPKNNPIAALQYPQYNFSEVYIYFDKVENKYRINGIVDLVNDRGEFSSQQNTFFTTHDNGYVKDFVNNTIDYGKHPTERKKLRHYKHRVFLRKAYTRVSHKYKMLFYIARNKQLYSNR